MNFEEATTELIPAGVREKVSSEVTAILESVTVLKIETEDQFLNSAKLTGEIKRVAKTLEENRTALTKPRNEELKDINAFFKGFSEKLDNAERTLKSAISTWQRAQEQKRIEAQRKADEEARKERERIEALARAQREKEEAARRAQEEAERKAREEQDAEKRKALEAEAEKRRKEADAAALKAQAKEESAAIVVPQIIEAPVKAKGISTKTTYKAKIVDKNKFAEHCLKSGLTALVSIDEGAANRICNTMKGHVEWPGVEIIAEEIVSVRAA